MKLQQLIGPKRERSIRAALIVAELNLVNAGGKVFDNRTHLAASKWRGSYIFEQRNS